MNHIEKHVMSGLGFQFVDTEYPLPDTEAHRFRSRKASATHRKLTPSEIVVLQENGNTADDWENIWVRDSFQPHQVSNCSFFGVNRIGRMAPIYLKHKDLKLQSGLFNSTFVSCDIGDDVAIHHVKYIANYSISDDVILFNVQEMDTSDRAKFGNGILKDGEPESLRISMELCNENGKRSVLPFDGMQAGDAYIWSRYRNDALLQQRLTEITSQLFSSRRGHYSEIGTCTVIKNTQSIKDVKIGSHAYIKGVNKLKNLTINSSEQSPTQIGEGCELVNGIIGHGCRVFYGVKAVRFVLSSHSQLKYGARLINSFLGDNSTISCCEVLNSLLFPGHEQHHNNSFLCAALVMGQSNMAAGATIGSNHNSRGADGEIIAERGFWPGLCVSLKHNSRFASYTMLVKGDYLQELDIKIPFSLVSNNTQANELQIIPGYWLQYNMYALVRNSHKYADRDKRHLKNQHLEYDIFAPDTINEVFRALEIIEVAVGRSQPKNDDIPQEAAQKIGKQLLNSGTPLNETPVYVTGFENSKRKTRLLKVYESYHMFKKMIRYYGGMQLAEHLYQHENMSLEEALSKLSVGKRHTFRNIGGQLIQESALQELISAIKTREIDAWEQVHQFYHRQSLAYPLQKTEHGIGSLLEIEALKISDLTPKRIVAILEEIGATKAKITEAIYRSRQKDYENPYTQMVYASIDEMEAVIGKLEDNTFITKQRQELETTKRKLEELRVRLESGKN